MFRSLIHHSSLFPFIVHHFRTIRSSFIIHRSSFSISSLPNHHSSFIIHRLSFIPLPNHHSSFIVQHFFAPSFIIHRSSFIVYSKFILNHFFFLAVFADETKIAINSSASGSNSDRFALLTILASNNSSNQ